VLRTNLSTRPFYNERLVHALAAVVAVVVVALLAWQGTRIVKLSRFNTELSNAIRRDRGEADQLTRQAADIRRRMNRAELEQVVTAASQANELIEQRTFSWTAFFNDIEQTLPEDVRLVSVRPEVKNDQSIVNMEIIAKRTEDVDAFMSRLEATGHFKDALPRSDTVMDDGSERVDLQAVYTGAGAAPGPKRAVATKGAAR
jgi:type IV pilus assembly protein PilN